MKVLTKHIVLVLMLCFAHPLTSQNELYTSDDTPLTIQDISEEDLETYRNDKNFNYEEGERKITFIDRFFEWLGNIIKKIFEFLFGEGKATGILAFLFRVLPYLILAILIYLLLRFFLKVDSQNVISNTAEGGSVLISEEEELIKHKDLNHLIKEAINQKNYRLAVRYYYLLTLKYLSDKNYIHWEQQKTNNDYIAEISTADLKTQFSDLTRIYDYVWYGEFHIDELQFEALKTSFDELNQNLN